MTAEIWAVIQEFPNYAVSNYGNVKSIRYDRYLAPRLNSYGHSRVTLIRDKIPYDLYVHRLVAQAFLPEYRPLLQVRHRDNNKQNNFVNNLRFGNGRRMGQLAKNIPEPQYPRIRIIETGEIFSAVKVVADYLDGDPSCIYRVLRGERLSYKGYTFEYFLEGSNGSAREPTDI